MASAAIGRPQRASQIPAEDRTHRLVELIYQAAVDPPRWDAFVRALSRECGGAAVGLRLSDPAAGLGTRYSCGLIDESASIYARHVAEGTIPWLANDALGEFWLANELVSTEPLSSSGLYRDYMEPQGLAPSAPMFCYIGERDDQVVAGVAAFQRVDGPPLTADHVARCNRLVPHLRRAYRIHRKMRGEEERMRALAQVVDRLPMGVMLLDAEQRVVIQNRTAERILAEHDGLLLDRERPATLDAAQCQRLRESIAAAVAAAAEGAPGAIHAIAVDRPSGAAAYAVLAAPLLSAPTAGDPRASVVSLCITDQRASETDTEALEQLYSLTPAEAWLACSLVSGASVEESARQRGIQVGTARSYLKRALRKTGTRSQRDLVRLVLTGVAPIRSDR